MCAHAQALFVSRLAVQVQVQVPLPGGSADTTQVVTHVMVNATLAQDQTAAPDCLLTGTALECLLGVHTPPLAPPPQVPPQKPGH